MGAGCSTFSVALEIQRLGWAEERKTGQAVAPGGGGYGHLCYRTLGVLPGGRLGPLPSPRTPGIKHVGVLILR